MSMKVKTAWYYKTWWKVMASPLTFYHEIKPQKWDEEPLSFILGSSWLAGLFVTIGIFFTQYLTIGVGLLQLVHGIEILYVMPALLVLALAFFLMTLLIAGGIVVGFFLALFTVLGLVLYGTARLMHGHGKLTDTLKAVFYSSAALQALGILVFIAILVKFHWLDFSLFMMGENVIYILSAIYLWGLMSIGCRRFHGTGRMLSIAIAAVPFIAALLVNWYLSSKFLPAFAPWLS